MKLKWKVADAPTGRYRSFERRGWPSASYPNGRPAVGLYCEDDYRPANIREGRHRPIVIRIADHSVRTEDGRPTFKWRTLKAQATTLSQAKQLAQEAVDKLVDFHPKV